MRRFPEENTLDEQPGRKPLPARAPTDAMTMTGIGDTIAPPGAGRKALPAQAPTEALTMTGVGPAN